MLNQCILVGRIKELHEGNIIIAVSRAWKNEKEEYDVDEIKVAIEGKINESVNEYCKKGDIVGVKGRLENVNDILVVKAEKITFLSSRTQDDVENEDDIDEEEEQID